MALRQQFIGSWSSAFENATRYYAMLSGGPSPGGATTDLEANRVGILPVPGTIRNLRVIPRDVLPGGDDQFIFTVQRGAAGGALANTGISVTVNNTTSITTGVTDTDSQYFDAGDYIVLTRVASGSAPANSFYLSYEWEPETPNVSVYSFSGNITSNLTNDQFEGFFSGGYAWAASAETQIDVVGIGGTIGGYRFKVSTAPGTGTSRTFTYYKNGVAQDGVGGTVDTRGTIADSATTVATSFSLAVVPGDRIAVKHATSGAPAAAKGVGVGWFVSSTPDTWNLCADMNVTLSGTATLFQWPNGDVASVVGDATETTRQHRAPVTTFYCYGLRVAVDQAPGAGTQWDYTLRKNAADTAQSATISGTNLTGQDAGGIADAVTIASGDLISFEFTPTNTPASNNGTRWALIALATNPTTIKQGTFVAGVTTTVSATRAAAFGLDGNTNTHSEIGVHKVFGKSAVTEYFELTEMTAPSGAANKARLFAVDNGAGKTRLMVQFGSGAAVQIAIEP